MTLLVIPIFLFIKDVLLLKGVNFLSKIAHEAEKSYIWAIKHNRHEGTYFAQYLAGFF